VDGVKIQNEKVENKNGNISTLGLGIRTAQTVTTGTRAVL